MKTLATCLWKYYVTPDRLKLVNALIFIRKCFWKQLWI